MRIREYTPADLDALRRMHASQGFDYAFPDLSDPIFISKLILEDDTGRPVMAALARLTCEMYLLIDRAAPSDSADRAADAAPNACHSERSPALFSSRGVRAARSEGLPGRRLVEPGRSVVEESLLDADPGNAPTPASCGVRELAPAVCRPGLPGSAPRIDSQSAPSQASENNSDEPRSRSREGNARQRWTQLLALHRAGELDLLARGLDDAHAWLPPQIAKRFGRRLESLGWLRDNTWTPYCRRLKP
jgi:hypothetical protein